jgi:hypothetical protein
LVGKNINEMLSSDLFRAKNTHKKDFLKSLLDFHQGPHQSPTVYLTAVSGVASNSQIFVIYEIKNTFCDTASHEDVGFSDFQFLL